MAETVRREPEQAFNHAHPLPSKRCVLPGGGGPLIGHGAESVPRHSFSGVSVFGFDEKFLRFA